jgi:subfamily B ATP-binding cassette protein MsbA
MRQLTRLVRYVAPYWWQLLSSLVLMAGVGLLDAFRVLLIGPILDIVLNPTAQSRDMQLFRVPGSGLPALA